MDSSEAKVYTNADIAYMEALPRVIVDGWIRYCSFSPLPAAQHLVWLKKNKDLICSMYHIAAFGGFVVLMVSTLLVHNLRGVWIYLGEIVVWLVSLYILTSRIKSVGSLIDERRRYCDEFAKAYSIAVRAIGTDAIASAQFAQTYAMQALMNRAHDVVHAVKCLNLIKLDSEDEGQSLLVALSERIAQLRELNEVFKKLGLSDKTADWYVAKSMSLL